MILLLAGRVIQVLLTMVQLRLATTFLSPQEFGIWSLIQTTANMYVLFGIGPFTLYLNRHIMEWNSKGLLPNIFVGYNKYVLLMASLSVVPSVLSMQSGLLNLPGHGFSTTALLISLFVISLTFQQTWIPSLNFVGDRKKYVLGLLTGITLGILFACIFYFFNLNRVETWVISLSSGIFISSLLFIPKDWFIPKYKEKGFLKNIDLKDMLLFSGPVLIVSIFSWSQTQGYRLLVENKLGLPELGKFAAGYAIIAGLYGSLENVIAHFYQANFFEKINRENSNYKEALDEAWKASLYPYILAGFFLFLTAPTLSKLFLSSTFTEEVSWLSYVAVAEGFRLIYSLLSIKQIGTKETKKLLGPQISAVILSLICISMDENLNFQKIVIYLGLGNLVSLLWVFFIDFKLFLQSRFLHYFGKAFLASSVFYFLAHLLNRYFHDIKFLIAVSFLGGLFMIPYIKEHISLKLTEGL